MGTGRICDVEECERPHLARGWCDMHYRRWRRQGNPGVAREHFTDPEDSFAARTEWQGECLVWIGGKTAAGYGSLSVNGRMVRAHRYAWEQEHGPIPEGFYVNHKCWDPACVNTEHLELVNNAENLAYRQGANSNSTSGFRNVHWNKREGKWRVQIRKNGKYYYFGLHDDLEEAAKVAERARQEVYGKFAGKGKKWQVST